MSYNDPYAHHGQYPQQQYQDAPFNPYEVQQQQASRGYEQPTYGDYNDDISGRGKEQPRSEFDNDEVVPRAMGEKTARNMRKWRTEYQGELWTKGSRASCIGRFFCCTIMIFLLFFISIVLSLALWLRPPNIIVGSPTPDLNSFNVNDSGISIDLPVDISVNNPNYFSVSLYSLDAKVIYPINSTQIGSGHMTNVDFKDHTQTNFTFPITISYDADTDPSGAVILDIAKHCGLETGVTASDLSVNVNIKVGIEILLVKFSTTISKSVSFECPLGSDTAAFEALLKALGIDINSLAALL